MSRKFPGVQRKKGDRLLYNSKLVALACMSVCGADRSAGTCTPYQSHKDRPGFSTGHSACVCVCEREICVCITETILTKAGIEAGLL